MRRHLIALFALFSGLAALQAPAHASSLDSMVFDARAFARANDTKTAQECVCKAQRQNEAARCEKRQRGSAPRRLLETLGLPVLFGSDRALE
jgi:hypothetical protein